MDISFVFFFDDNVFRSFVDTMTHFKCTYRSIDKSSHSQVGYQLTWIIYLRKNNAVYIKNQKRESENLLKAMQ